MANKDYLDLLKQKRKVEREIDSCNARDFAATSYGEKKQIASELEDYEKVLVLINKQLDGNSSK